MKNGQVVYRNLDEKSIGLMNPNGTYGQDFPSTHLRLLFRKINVTIIIVTKKRRNYGRQKFSTQRKSRTHRG